MKIISPVFQDKYSIPPKYTCDGYNNSPPLEFIDVPVEAKSLVLIVDDPDASNGTFVHWLLWNIDPKTNRVKEDIAPKGAVAGKNSYESEKYTGPCPPKEEEHRYVFKLYALDIALQLRKANKIQLEDAMAGHIIDNAELIGLYKRKAVVTAKMY